MICPYCNSEMKKGIISCGRHAPKWVEGSHFLERYKKGIKLSSFYEGNCVTAYYCSSCKKILIDLKQL